jgi:hypothetical protein
MVSAVAFSLWGSLYAGPWRRSVTFYPSAVSVDVEFDILLTHTSPFDEGGVAVNFKLSIKKRRNDIPSIKSTSRLE